MIYNADYTDIFTHLLPLSIRDWDLLTENNDIVVSDSTEQEAYFILNSFQGTWYFTPLIGIGLTKYLANKINKQRLKAEIQSQFVKDGLVLSDLIIVDQTDLPRIKDENLKNAIIANKVILSFKAVR